MVRQVDWGAVESRRNQTATNEEDRLGSQPARFCGLIRIICALPPQQTPTTQSEIPRGNYEEALGYPSSWITPRGHRLAYEHPNATRELGRCCSQYTSPTPLPPSNSLLPTPSTPYR